MTAAKKIENQNSSDYIDALGELKTVDAVRELIQIYKNCEWRETKFQILNQISQFSHQRSFQFLFQIALEHKDLPLSEKAIQCLSVMNHSMSRRFLNHQYQTGPSHLKPAIIKALAAIPDRTRAADFLEDLKKSLTQNQNLLSKNLTLALGEFKYAPAIDLLFQIAADKKQRDLALSAIVSLGQILRTTEKFVNLESDFKKDSFEYQIYTTSLHQIQFRSQWKLEDYLQKFYSTDKYHPALFFEIASFSNADIKAGLELFITPENTEKTLILLSHLRFDVCIDLYEKYASEIGSDFVLNSLIKQNDSRFKKIILDSKNIKNSTWLDCVSSVLPNADEIYKDTLNSTDYSDLNESEKMNVINFFSDYLCAMTGDSKKVNTCGKWIEVLLANEKNENVQGRWIRLLSDSSFESSSLNTFLAKNITHKKLCASILYYLKNNPHHNFSELLLVNHEFILNTLNLKSQFVKALATQAKDKADDSKIWTLINLLKNTTDINLQIEILKLLEKNSLIEAKTFVIEGLSAKNDHLNLFSVLAIKKYHDEAVSENIALLLNSKNSVVSGRAFDTILSQPGLRAKRLAMDYFKDHAVRNEICEKMIRSFQSPENATDYFSKVVSEIIQKNPDHQMLENLKDFQNQLESHQQTENKNQFASSAEDIQKIEKDLEKKLIYYKFYDETAKSALRSAEMPFQHPEMYDRYIDKSAIILGYSKAIDIILEKQLGRKILFPALEKRIFEFQNAVHTLGLNEDYPNSEKVLKNLNLEKDFSAQSLPVHKMSLVAHGILNTKFINDHFKILDGLRAWSVILLLFSRKTQLQPKPLVPLFSDDTIIVSISKKLMWLQDQRNPVAHRQTVIDFKSLEQLRAEVFQILVSLNPLFEK